eukprot:scpid40518/ scgid22353/ 
MQCMCNALGMQLRAYGRNPRLYQCRIAIGKSTSHSAPFFCLITWTCFVHQLAACCSAPPRNPVQCTCNTAPRPRTQAIHACMPIHVHQDDLQSSLCIISVTYYRATAFGAMRERELQDIYVFEIFDTEL